MRQMKEEAWGKIREAWGKRSVGKERRGVREAWGKRGVGKVKQKPMTRENQ